MILLSQRVFNGARAAEYSPIIGAESESVFDPGTSVSIKRCSFDMARFVSE